MLTDEDDMLDCLTIHQLRQPPQAMVMKFVNDVYARTAFGLPMRFVRQ